MSEIVRELVDEVRALREELVELRHVVSAAELGEREARRPGRLDINAAARELGEHPSTMRRRIASLPEAKRPRWTGTAQRRRYYWQSAPDLYRWLESLEERPPTRTPRRPRREARGGGITDFVSVARGKT